MDFELEKLVRPNIWALEPYSCARDEFKGMDAHVFLDANESPYHGPINRYPDPLQEKVKERLSPIKQVRPSQIQAWISKRKTAKRSALSWEPASEAPQASINTIPTAMKADRRIKTTS